MKQRLGIAAAMLGDPPVLMFDEPVNGLDPEGIHWIRGFFRELAADGRTVLVSSHLMSEMAQTADHLVIIGRGRLLADTSTAELIESSARRDVLLRSPQRDELARLIAADGGTAATPARWSFGGDWPGRGRHRRAGGRPWHRPARPGAPAGLAGRRLPRPHRRRAPTTGPGSRRARHERPVPGHPGNRPHRFGVDQIPFGPFDLLGPAGRGRHPGRGQRHRRLRLRQC